MDERKRREKKPNPSPAYELVLHKTINDPTILDQFTVSYTRSKKYTQRELIMSLYIYEDRLEITRNIPLGDSCVEFDAISFNELDSIQIKRYGFYNKWDGLFITGQFVPGIMMLLPMQGTKYSMYAASEYENKRPVPIKPSPIEIWFDMKYNDLIREHNPMIQKIFRDYKRKQKEEKNINPDIYVGRDLYNWGDFFSSKVNQVDHSIHYLMQQTLERTSGAEREEMLQVLKEVENLVQEMREKGTLSKSDKSFIDKAGDHFRRNSWFYSGIVKIIGEAAIKYIFGAE